jgi:hypothetical protein
MARMLSVSKKIHSKKHPVIAAAVTMLCAAALPSGCAGGDESQEPTRPKRTEIPRFDPDNFAKRVGANKWLPLRPGTQWVREGRTDVGHRRLPHRVVSTVTDVYKKVAGVRAVAVLDQDIDGGEVAQQSIDFFAEDRQGNVWDLGSYAEGYEGGRFANVDDAWASGVKGGKPGIIMLGDPRLGTPQYYVARPPGEEADVAQVVRTGESRCVPFKCYKNVVVVREGKAANPDNEFKYFAPGVGQIDNEPRSASRHRDIEDLYNLTQLTPQGLAELSAEALKLDRSSRVRRPEVFGRVPAARRAP